MLALGAHGGITASAHLATADFAGLISAWYAEDSAAARPLGHRLSRLSATLFAAPNPTLIKAALHSQARITSPHVRLPLLPSPPPRPCPPIPPIPPVPVDHGPRVVLDGVSRPQLL
jgi:4-hydroxy-tetrahydrodipicolinate synthase